jgi:hypothetical protein
MPSPFPGMDLEDPAFWSGFSQAFVAHLCAALPRALPPDYVASAAERTWCVQEDEDDGAAPDHIIEPNEGRPTVGTPPTCVGTLAPLVARSQHFVSIVNRSQNRVVTAIEVFHPWNKERGPDRVAYRYTRADYFTTRTNLVEIDLLRAGDRVPFGKPKPPDADFYALVSRANMYPKAHVWAFTVRDELPVLPIPLKPADGEIALSLRERLDRTYDDGGYANRIDYAAPPAYPLRKPDAERATGHLRAAR